MRCVITGGCGFIGSRLSKALVGQGHTVVAVDNLTAQIHGEIPRFEPVDGVEYKRIDVRDTAPLAASIEGSDVVFHLAAETGTGQSMYSANLYTDVNVQGTASLIEAIGACKLRPQKVVLASSRSVYGEGAYIDNDTGSIVAVRQRPLSQLQDESWQIVDARQREMSACATPEEFKLTTVSVYAATKLAQEFLLYSASDALGVSLVSLRFQNVYGEGQSLNNPYTGLLSIFFNRGRQGLDLALYEDGLTARDFVHVDDVVSSLTLAAEESTDNGDVFNIGSGVPTTVTEVAEKLISIGKFDCDAYISGKFRAGDIRCCYADISRAREILGFECKVTLDQGLSRLVAWGLTQPVFGDRSEIAELELVEKGLGN